MKFLDFSSGRLLQKKTIKNYAKIGSAAEQEEKIMKLAKGYFGRRKKTFGQ
jgi:hypothetical protein